MSDVEFIPAHSTHEVKSASTCTAREYGTTDPDLNIARVEIHGRFPATGSMRNTKVKEIVYVERGQGNVEIDGVVTAIHKGDVILYQPNELVAWDGDLTLVIACSPSWTPDQHEMQG